MKLIEALAKNGSISFLFFHVPIILKLMNFPQEKPRRAGRSRLVTWLKAAWAAKRFVMRLPAPGRS